MGLHLTKESFPQLSAHLEEIGVPSLVRTVLEILSSGLAFSALPAGHEALSVPCQRFTRCFVVSGVVLLTFSLQLL